MNHRSRNLIEIGANAVLWIGWIVMMNSGTENGIGYFHQPGHELLWPLINGALFNAVIFVANAFWLMPRYLQPRRFGAYMFRLVTLSAAVLLFKTLSEKVLILLAYPDLRSVSLHRLALENLWVLLAMIVLSLFYGFGRDWLIGSKEPPRETGRAEPTAIWIKSGTSRERVVLDDIVHVRASDNYVTFELGNRRLMSLMSMIQVMDELPEKQFLRIHRSHIVSLDKVQSISANSVVIGDQTLPIGRTYRKQVRRHLATIASTT